MQFHPISCYAGLLTLFVSLVLGAANMENALSNINNLNAKIERMKVAMDDYNGGLLGAIPVASAVYDAHGASTLARKSLDEQGSFSEDDGDRYLHQLNRLHSLTLSALESANVKVWVAEYRRLSREVI